MGLEKLMESRKVLANEKRDWMLGQDMLDSQIAVLKQEVEALTARIADADRSVAEAQAKHLELLTERDRLRAASTRATERLKLMEANVLALIQRLPDPLKEAVKPMGQRIPEPDTTTRLTVSERYQSIVYVLNQINKFHREVSMKPELREIEPGVMAQVTAIYFGLGQAYFATQNGEAAAVGKPGPSGWVWTPTNPHGAAIARLASILRNEQPAAFVQVPTGAK
jgi:hypothetical protein